MRLLQWVALFSLCALPSCARLTESDAFADPIEQAHGASAWRAQVGAQMNLRVDFPGKTQLEGVLTTAPEGARTRLETIDGSVVVSTGESVHVSPASAANPRMRFHALTWSYFLAAPFKLQDSGSTLEEEGPMEMNGQIYDTARLTFGEGVGDAPDDWYVLYRDSETGMLAAMAYIVTFGREPGTVTEADAHAIVYRNFEVVDGVRVPMRWDFYHWSREEGPHGEPIGEVTLNDFRFLERVDGMFTPASDAIAVDVP